MKLRDKLLKAYEIGFLASGEGWNAEYPFSDHQEALSATKSGYIKGCWTLNPFFLRD